MCSILIIIATQLAAKRKSSIQKTRSFKMFQIEWKRKLRNIQILKRFWSFLPEEEDPKDRDFMSSIRSKSSLRLLIKRNTKISSNQGPNKQKSSPKKRSTATIVIQKHISMEEDSFQENKASLCTQNSIKVSPKSSSTNHSLNQERKTMTLMCLRCGKQIRVVGLPNLENSTTL